MPKNCAINSELKGGDLTAINVYDPEEHNEIYGHLKPITHITPDGEVIDEVFKVYKDDEEVKESIIIEES
jgi:hypothetical protein